MENQERLLDISWGTIFKISLVVIIFYILARIKDILIWFVFALMIAILFEPAVKFLRRYKIPRVLAVCFLYIGFFGLVVLLVYSTIPMFISEMEEFSRLLPQYFEKASPSLKMLGFEAFADMETAIEALGKALSGIAGNVFNAFFAIFGGIFTTLFSLTVAIFLSLEERGVEENLVLFFPKKHEDYVLSLWKRCENKISSWFLVRVAACLFVGIVSYIAFLLLNIQYPFTLGLIAAGLNFIPIVGPFTTGVLLFLTVALDNILKAIFVVAVFSLIQQVENNILTPILSKKLFNLSPVLVLFSLAIGGVLWGVTGAILATPLVGIVFEFLKDYLKQKREKEMVGVQS